MAEDRLVLLIPRVEAVMVEDHVARQVRFGRREGHAFAQRLGGAQVEGLAPRGVLGEGDARVQRRGLPRVRRAPAAAGELAAHILDGHRVGRHHALGSQTRGARVLSTTSSPASSARTRFSVGS